MYVLVRVPQRGSHLGEDISEGDVAKDGGGGSFGWMGSLFIVVVVVDVVIIEEGSTGLLFLGSSDEWSSSGVTGWGEVSSVFDDAGGLSDVH